MIKIKKGDAPKNLAVINATLVKKMNAEFDANEADYRHGGKKGKTFKFTSDYATDEVRNALIKCQFNKCCFSEAKFVGDYSNVEHFRPKGKVDPYPNGNSHYPGYYWLAYDWSNLFLCKARINSSDKRNFFPLKNEKNRNRSHRDSNKEKSLFINCSEENPRKYIRFVGEEPKGVDSAGRGEFNIKFFQLRHTDFTEARRERLAFLKAMKELIEIAIAKGEKKKELKLHIDQLRATMSPGAEFSSMAIDFLSGWPHFE